MSWHTTDARKEREQFIQEYEQQESSIVGLAERFGISRKTAYKWLERYRAEGRAGLGDRTRRPRQQPTTLPVEVETVILALKARWPRWGAPKLVIKLREQMGGRSAPSESSASRVLRRYGLVRPQGRRAPRAQGTVLQDYTGPNAIWCADFKGWFILGDGTKCTPLTISDGFSRYLLRCQGLQAGTGYQVVEPLFTLTMREYGVPAAIRTDNGAPFACVGLGGLSELSIGWLKLGIRLERSRPGCPQDNGRHERMHRTLQEATAQPPQENGRAQQQAFAAFRQEYNEERPHEGLGGQTPAAVYQPSTRDYPRRVPEVNYEGHWLTRQVRTSGAMKWRGREIYVSKALRGERIGLEPIADGQWMIYFARQPLGLFDERQGDISALKGRRASGR